jgi:hypothetical protein
MSLRQQIVYRVSINIPWALVWVETRGGFVGGWLRSVLEFWGIA